MRKTAVAVAVAASTLGLSQFATADFVKDSKLSLDLRNYYYQHESKFLGGGQWAQGFMLNYQSGFTEGAVGFGVDLLGAAGYKLAEHGDFMGYMLLHDAPDRLNKAGATLKARIGKTNAYAGALRPNTPVFVANDARLLPELVEGVLVTNQDVDGLTLAAGHVTKYQSRDWHEWNDLGANQFSLFGADYQVMDGLTAQYYYGQQNNEYKQHFVGLKYAADLAGGKLGADFRYFNTKDDSGSGNANNLWSVLVNYSAAGHTIGLGYQKTSEDYGFQTTGVSKYLISERMIYAMDNPDEAVTLVSYGFDFGVVGVKGLNASIVHQMGDSGIGRDGGTQRIKVDHAETDLVVGYTVQEGHFKGLGAVLMHGMYDGDDTFNDERQTRFIVNYSIPLM